MPTIAAIATAPGNGGIAIVRMTGPSAKSWLARIFLPHSSKFVNFRPWTLHRGTVLDSEDSPLDEALAVFMPGPRSYTGEDVVEIHCHGGQLIVATVLKSLLRLGARLAEPGEFTRRAYLNGRMDLTQAEAVAELITAPSREALRNGLERLEGRLADIVRSIGRQLDDLRVLSRLGIDFPDEEIEGLTPKQFARKCSETLASIDELLKGAKRGRFMADGAKVVLAGAPNVGKSSLFNALAGRNRALVTEVAGTTRDFLEERLDLEGLPVSLLDTAGLRAEQPKDPIEKLGISKARELIEEADLLLLIADCADPKLTEQLDKVYKPLLESSSSPCMLIWNKIDACQPPEKAPDWAVNLPTCAVSALTGNNLEILATQIRERLLACAGNAPGENSVTPNMRQTEILEKARLEIIALLQDIENDMPYECWLSHLDSAVDCLGQIVPLAADSEVLDMIFSRFCIGK